MLLREYVIEWWFCELISVHYLGKHKRQKLSFQSVKRKQCRFRDVCVTEKTISGVYVSPDSAETLVRRGGITNHHSIAYPVSNITAKHYQNRLMCVEMCNISVVFSDSVEMQKMAKNTAQCAAMWRITWYFDISWRQNQVTYRSIDWLEMMLRTAVPDSGTTVPSIISMTWWQTDSAADDELTPFEVVTIATVWNLVPFYVSTPLTDYQHAYGLSADDKLPQKRVVRVRWHCCPSTSWCLY